MWPFGFRNPSSLYVLESLGTKCPATMGPGVEMIRRIYSDPGALKEHRSSFRRKKGGQRRWRSNPVGHSVPPSARYDEVLPPSAPPPLQLMHSSSAPAGVFFQTEVEVEERKPMSKTPSVPLLPKIEQLSEVSTAMELRDVSAVEKTTEERMYSAAFQGCSFLFIPVRVGRSSRS